MLNILKTLILDFLETPLETGTLRDTQIQSVLGKATVCVGVRRCGKTTFMFQIIQSLLKKDVKRENILYLNFFDDRLHSLKYDGLGIILDAYYSLYRSLKSSII